MVNRRDFIASLFRNSFLLVLATLSGFLIFKEKGNGKECDLDFVCKSCNKSKSCTLAEAEQYRKKKLN